MPAPSPVQNTLSADTIQILAQNTYAVKTHAPDQLSQWRETLVNARKDEIARGNEETYEVAFVEDLLAILDDQAPTLPADNPYADVVRQVVEAIQNDRSQDET